MSISRDSNSSGYYPDYTPRSSVTPDSARSSISETTPLIQERSSETEVAKEDKAPKLKSSVSTRLKEGLFQLSRKISSLSQLLISSSKYSKGKFIFSMPSAIGFNRSAMNKIDKTFKSPDNETGLLAIGKAGFRKVTRGVLKTATQLGSKLIYIPIALTYEVASGVLKCIKKAPIDIYKAAKLGKIQLQTDLAKIDDSAKASKLKKIQTVGFSAIKFFGNALLAIGSSTLLSSLKVVEFLTKGAVLLAMNPATVAGKRGEVFNEESKTKKVFKSVNSFFEKASRTLNSNFDKKINEANTTELDRLIKKHDTELLDLTKKRVPPDKLNAELKNYSVKMYQAHQKQKSENTEEKFNGAAAAYVEPKKIGTYIKKNLDTETQYLHALREKTKCEIEQIHIKKNEINSTKSLTPRESTFARDANVKLDARLLSLQKTLAKSEQDYNDYVNKAKGLVILYNVPPELVFSENELSLAEIDGQIFNQQQQLSANLKSRVSLHALRSTTGEFFKPTTQTQSEPSSISQELQQRNTMLEASSYLKKSLLAEETHFKLSRDLINQKLQREKLEPTAVNAKSRLQQDLRDLEKAHKDYTNTIKELVVENKIPAKTVFPPEEAAAAELDGLILLREGKLSRASQPPTLEEIDNQAKKLEDVKKTDPIDLKKVEEQTAALSSYVKFGLDQEESNYNLSSSIIKLKIQREKESSTHKGSLEALNQQLKQLETDHHIYRANVNEIIGK